MRDEVELGVVVEVTVGDELNDPAPATSPLEPARESDASAPASVAASTWSMTV